ncbi:MAG: metallophosphoesterase family protein, partial [Thermoanaerobaculia bacterium]
LRDAEGAQLLVTGDVTTVGKETQFTMAERYLAAFVAPPDANYWGLAAADWGERAVSGNHDHWPGLACVWGPPTRGLNDTFPARPFVGAPIQLSTGQRLRFIGIDTDADVRPFGIQRFLARGSFCSQLTEAATSMEIPDPNEVRVLLLHHSRAWPGKTLRMETASRDALDDFLCEQDIAVMLCGHTHVPHVQPFSLTRTGRTIEILEARAGTTTQRDTIPYEWRNLLRRRPKRTLPPNTLLVHRLLDEDGTLVWHAETFVRLPSGFVKLRTGPEARLQVWPRPA